MSFTHYRPARWQPEFDWIVMDSVRGMSNTELGRKYGYTKEHISNILSTEEAKKVKEKIRDVTNKEYEKGLKERFSKIGEMVVDKMVKFMEDDGGLSDKSPFMYIDRAIKIGQVVGTLNGDKSGNVGINVIGGNTLIVNGEQGDRIKEGLFKSSELDGIEIGDSSIKDRVIDDGRLKIIA